MNKATTNHWPWTIVVAALPFLLYFPVLTHLYAHTDDYPLLYQGEHAWIDPWRGLCAVNGRPLLGAVIAYISLLPQSFADLVYYRVAGMVGTSIFAALLFQLALRAGYATRPAFFLTALSVATPSIGVYVGWASCWFFIYGGIVGLLSGAVMSSALDERIFSTRQLLRVGLSFLLLFASLCIYQTVATFYIVSVLLFAYQQRDKGSFAVLSRGVCAGSLFFCTTLIYFILFKLQAAYLLPVTKDTARTQLASNPLEKISYFFGDLLRLGAAGWFRFLGEHWQWVSVVLVALLASFALFSFERKAFQLRWSWFLLAAGILPLTVFPNLIVAENGTAFRVLPVLYTVMALLVVTGFETIHAKLENDFAWAGRGAVAAFVLWTGLNFAAAHYFVWQGIVRMQTEELSIYRAYIDQNSASLPKGFLFIYPQNYDAHFCHTPFLNEYSIISSSLPWVPDPLCHQLLYEKFNPPGNPDFAATRKLIDAIPVTVLQPWEPRPSDAESFEVVDGRKLIQDLPPIAMVEASFDSAANIPITALGYSTNGAALNLTLNFSPATGSVLTVIHNTGAAPINGTFVNLPESGAISAIHDGDKYNFRASYQGGAGHDLTLTLTAITDAITPFNGLPLGDDWYYSDWFGTYSRAKYPWIYRTDLGFICVKTVGPDIYLLIKNSQTGNSEWFRASKSDFPDVYSVSRNCWLNYKSGTGFYNYTTHVWEKY